MSDSEKLAELISEIQYMGGLESRLAEHLIANGVTIQKWIPVTERLPDKHREWVLCLCVGGAMEVLNFDFTMWNWDSQYPGRCYMEKYVTHWMPLPEPPMEE